jgi:hypothetical protein
MARKGDRMAGQSGSGGTGDKATRRARGFLQAGALISAQTRTAAAKRGYAAARLRALWPEIAGPEIAAVAEPIRLAAARGPAGGLLTLAVHGANGPQVQMLVPLIRERVNAAMGPGTVGRVQITQARGAPPPPAPPPRTEPDLASADIGTLEPLISSIGDPDLRRALETLARNVILRSESSR